MNSSLNSARVLAHDSNRQTPRETSPSAGAGGELAQECGTEPAAYLSEAPVMSTYTLEDGTQMWVRRYDEYHDAYATGR